MSNQLTDLADFTFVSKYPQYIPDKKRRETYTESSQRFRKMFEDFYIYKDIKDELDFAFDCFNKKEVLGSQRALQFAGPAILKKHERCYNCCGSYVNRPRVFAEIMFLLLCGVGCGVSVQKHHVAWLPELIQELPQDKIVFTIPDSIEGWADSIGAIVNSFFDDNNPYSGKKIVFDYSQIRPKGAPFSHGVGRAPGPDGLKNAHEKIVALLERCVEAKQNKLRPIDAYDIIMHSSDAVLSGGIRRSAVLIMFSLDDEDMMNAKTGNWFLTNPQRARSNNSVTLLKGKVSKEEFISLIKRTKEFGEPGVIWVNSYECIFNPCVESVFYSYDTTDPNYQETPEYSGWQFCNLSSQNGAKIKTLKDFLRTAAAATILGTLQAGFTSFPYLGKRSENITRKEALIGVSITGMMENPEVILNAKNQEEVANHVKHVNEILAQKIGINPAARCTLLKPEGSGSIVLGCMKPGIHPEHAAKYIRHVQVNKSEAPALHYKSLNPIAVKDSVWSNNKTDYVVAFACRTTGGLLKKDLTAIEHLKYVLMTQNNWVKYGKRPERCSKDFLDQNVSNTIIVKEFEWDEVTDFIFDNQQSFAGVSLLSAMGDLDYNQAPFVEVLDGEELVQKYGDGALFTSGIIEQAIAIWGDLWVAGDTFLGIGEDLFVAQANEYDEHNRQLKLRWVERVKNFSKKYHQGEFKKTLYLLKEVYNYKYWLDLQKRHRTVNWEKFIEEENTTEGTDNIACGGGACLI